MSIDARRRSLIVALFVLMASSTPTLVRAQAATPPEIGSQVVIKAGASLKVGEQVVDTGKSHRVYKVEKSNGDWLWLVSGTVAGWARLSDVLLLEQAVEFYTAEIDRNPHAPWPYYNRGIIYHDLKDEDKAFADYSAAIRQDPKFVPALINRGNIWLSRRTSDRAIADFSVAIQVEPTSILAHLNRAIALQAKGDIDKALDDYDEAIRLGLKTAPSFNNRGHAREMKKDYGGAITDYSEAIRLDPGYALAWVNRGSARQAKGEYEQALTDFSEYIRLAPESPWGYAHRAWVLATCPESKFRNGKESVALATQATDMVGPKDSYFLDVRAAAHAEAGDFAEAVFWETKAIDSLSKAADKDADAYRSRLELYRAKKPYRERQSAPRP